MIIGHVSDVHLGYRAFPRLSAGGVNARERDVAAAFGAVVDRLVALRPALVLLAGDLFHAPRPSGWSVAEGLRHLRRLRAGLPDSPLVSIAGRHDAPHGSDGGGILSLVGEVPGLLAVVADRPGRIRLAALDAEVICLPHPWPARVRPLPEPDPSVRHSFLLAYGPALPEILLRGRWTYVALGQRHEAQQVASNAWYSGATERTTGDPWSEASGARGFLTFDTDAGRARFHEVPTRPVLDLEPLSGRSRQGDLLDPAALDAAIAARLEAVQGGVEGKLVRLIVRDVPGPLARALDRDRLRQLRSRCLRFQLELHPPANDGRAGEESARSPSLEAEVGSFLRQRWRPADGLDRDRLVALAATYLEGTAQGVEAPVEDARRAVPAGARDDADPGSRAGPLAAGSRGSA